MLHPLCAILLHLLRNMSVSIQSECCGGMTEIFLHGFNVVAAFDTGNCVCVPLRYNNDKQKKPLFSRGLSVCRLLFNSFSKLKIDENYKEKRRLFY